MTKQRPKMNIAGTFTQAVEEANATTPEAKPKANPATRTGRVSCPFWIPTAARKQLKYIVTDLNMTSQDALTEALNDWFTKHGKPPIA